MKSFREIRQSMEYVAVRGALAVAGSLPLGIARGLGAFVGRLACILRIRRDVCIDNITRALDVNEQEAARIMRRSYENLGRGTMEFAAFRRWSSEDVKRLVRLDGVEHLEAARRAGRGALLLTGHMGSWELTAAVVAAHGFPMSAVIGEQTNARVDDVMNDLRRAQGIGLITRTSALKKVLQALRKNEFVGLLADQDARKGGILVDFLGRPASTVRGPALFAIRAGCPVITMGIHREGRGHVVAYDAPLWPDPAWDEDRAVFELTRHYNDALSRRVRAHPEEYFWPHRRWKSADAQVAQSQASAAIT
jgi:KDO2-lipid IV(A) lauroyltransferase